MLERIVIKNVKLCNKLGGETRLKAIDIDDAGKIKMTFLCDNGSSSLTITQAGGIEVTFNNVESVTYDLTPVEKNGIKFYQRKATMKFTDGTTKTVFIETKNYTSDAKYQKALTELKSGNAKVYQMPNSGAVAIKVDGEYFYIPQNSPGNAITMFPVDPAALIAKGADISAIDAIEIK